MDVSDKRRSRRSRGATVVILPNAAANLPDFELQPKGFAGMLMTTLGLDVRLNPRTMDAEPRSSYELFQDRYSLIESPDVVGFRRGTVFSPAPPSEPPTKEAAHTAIRDEFRPDIVRYFAEHPGWCVEVRRPHVAIWREGKIVTASELEQFFQSVFEVYDVLPASEAG